MGQLGEVLESVCRPGDRFETVLGALRRRRYKNSDNATKVLLGERDRRNGTEQDLPTNDTVLYYWVTKNIRMRIEKYSCSSNGCTESYVTLIDGDQITSMRPTLQPSNEAQVSGKPPHRFDIDRHFDPATFRRFIDQLDLEYLDSAVLAERPCWRIRGVLRPGGMLWPHWLPHCADEYEFQIDAERGVLLSILGRYGDNMTDVAEVIFVKFDELIPEEYFTPLPGGVDNRLIVPSAERVKIADAIRRVPFTVLVASNETAYSLRDVLLIQSAHTSVRRTMLSLAYCDEASRFITCFESEIRDPTEPTYEWEERLMGQQIVRICQGKAPGGSKIVSLQKSGTFVTIFSPLSREAMLDFAGSLEPA